MKATALVNAREVYDENVKNAKVAYHDGYIQGLKNGKATGEQYVKDLQEQLARQVKIIEESKKLLNAYKGQCAKNEDEIVKLNSELAKLKNGLDAIRNIHAELRSGCVFRSPGVYVKDEEGNTKKL